MVAEVARNPLRSEKVKGRPLRSQQEAVVFFNKLFKMSKA